jgi:hypothetical protein
MKGAVLYDLHNHNVLVSRNVTHHDHILPYTGSNTSIDWSYHTPRLDSFQTDHTTTKQSTSAFDTPTPLSDDINQATPSHPSTSIPLPDCLVEQSTLPNCLDDQVSDTNEQDDEPTDLNSPPPESTTPDHISSPSHSPPPPLRKSTRNSTRPTHLSDYVCNLSKGSSQSTSSGILYPLSDFHSFSKVSKNFENYALSITATVEPKDFKHASQHQCWIDAMNAEIGAL